MAFVVTATWTAREGSEDIVLGAIRNLIPASRMEPGCRFYQPSRDPENPREYLFFEIYDDEAAYHAHVTSEHFERYAVGHAIPELERRERAFSETIDPT